MRAPKMPPPATEGLSTGAKVAIGGGVAALLTGLAYALARPKAYDTAAALAAVQAQIAAQKAAAIAAGGAPGGGGPTPGEVLGDVKTGVDIAKTGIDLVGQVGSAL